MAKQKTLKMYETTFEVTGKGPFPLDMLRYDTCFPDRQEDVERMLDGKSKEARTVRLVKRSINDSGPASQRWSSFGWSVNTNPQ